jgi:hypothetical protein
MQIASALCHIFIFKGVSLIVLRVASYWHIFTISYFVNRTLGLTWAVEHVALGIHVLIVTAGLPGREIDESLSISITTLFHIFSY